MGLKKPVILLRMLKNENIKDLVIGINYEIRYSLFFKNKIIEFKEVL
jgi:hypothetical protein